MYFSFIQCIYHLKDLFWLISSLRSSQHYCSFQDANIIDQGRAQNILFAELPFRVLTLLLDSNKNPNYSVLWTLQHFADIWLWGSDQVDDKCFLSPVSYKRVEERAFIYNLCTVLCVPDHSVGKSVEKKMRWEVCSDLSDIPCVCSCLTQFPRSSPEVY